MKTIAPEQAQQLIIEGMAQTPEERMEAADERLKELVAYVKEYSPYFKKAYKDIGDDFSLTDLPITTKAGLMECYDDWVTDSEITEEGVREYLSDIENIHENFLGRYTVLTTSGTTGKPMPMVRDSYRNTIHGTMLSIRLLRGEFNLFAHKVASVIATDGTVSSYTSALRFKKSMGENADRLMLLSILTPIHELVETLNNFQPEVLTGYPSILTLLALEKKKGTLKISPIAIASSAEKMSRESYELISEAFNCPVLDNYCSTEGGEIAMSCRLGHLHLNDDWILMEPVDDDFNPVPPGEWSTGVLVTDLTNYIQPIIRYHVGDCVRFSESPCECGLNLPVVEIMGRMGDTLFLNDVYVAFPVVYFMLNEVPDLLSWQIIQSGENLLELRFCEAADGNRADVAKAAVKSLKESLKSYGAGEVEIIVSDEDAEKSPRGGKTPNIIRR